MNQALHDAVFWIACGLLALGVSQILIILGFLTWDVTRDQK